MIFRVQIYRTSSAEAVIEVDADSPGEAREIAEQRGRDGLAHWDECGDDFEMTVELLEKCA